jgi:hypothetical protein
MKHRIRACHSAYSPPYYIQRKWLGIFWLNVGKAYNEKEAEEKLATIRKLEAL